MFKRLPDYIPFLIIILALCMFLNYAISESINEWTIYQDVQQKQPSSKVRQKWNRYTDIMPPDGWPEEDNSNAVP